MNAYMQKMTTCSFLRDSKEIRQKAQDKTAKNDKTECDLNEHKKQKPHCYAKLADHLTNTPWGLYAG